MGSLFREIRFSLRQLRKSPGFALTAVLTLALGIGATSAIFSIVEGVLLRPLPFPDPGRLVTLGDNLEGVDSGRRCGTGDCARSSDLYARHQRLLQPGRLSTFFL